MEEKYISGCDSNLTNAENCDFTSENETFRLWLTFIYCLMFVIATMGNFTVFIALSRRRHQMSRVSLMMRHLAGTDLLVTFLTIPLEVSWLLAAQWMAGNMACNFFLFLRVFGLYLSRNVLICVSLDRYSAVFHPRNTTDALRRGKMMLIVAWICSILYSLSPNLIFQTSTHLIYPKFRQCLRSQVSINHAAGIANSVFWVVVMYVVPSTITCWTCTRILCRESRSIRGNRPGIKISGRDWTTDTYNTDSTIGMKTLRMSKISTIKLAKTLDEPSLQMTIAIVTLSIICWTPYVVMTLWFTFDRDSSLRDDTWLREWLFILVITNSCVNPMICGSYVIDCQSLRPRCCVPRLRAPQESHDMELSPRCSENLLCSELLEGLSVMKKVRFAEQKNQRTSETLDPFEPVEFPN